MRIFAISDLHVDYEENLKWVQALSEQEYIDDILILGGDISHKMHLLTLVFVKLRKCFKEVFFVPGNHDIWIPKNETGTSIEKYHKIIALAATHDILMSSKSWKDVTIVPLLGWYDYSFGEPSKKLKLSWQDYYWCKWPEELDTDEKRTDYFLNLNIPQLEVSTKKVISFSHFMPRIDLMPGFIPNRHHFVYPVLGTNKLFDQIAKLKSVIHIYGHSHVNVHKRMDSTLYMNNAYGYPSEKSITYKGLKCILEI